MNINEAEKAHQIMSENNNIGKIDVFGKFTFFQIPSGDAEGIVEQVNNKRYQGKKILCEIAKPRR